MYFFKYPTCRLRIGGVAGATERTDGVVDHLIQTCMFLQKATTPPYPECSGSAAPPIRKRQDGYFNITYNL